MSQDGTAAQRAFIKKEEIPANPYIKQIEGKPVKKRRTTLSGRVQVPMNIKEQERFCIWVYQFFQKEKCDPLLMLSVLHGQLITTMLSAVIALAVYDKPEGVTQDELKATIETVFPSEGFSRISQYTIDYKVERLLVFAARPLLVIDQSSGRILFTKDEAIVKNIKDYLEMLSDRRPKHDKDDQLRAFNAALACFPNQYQDFRPVLERLAINIVEGGFEGRKLYLGYALDLMYRRCFTSPLTRQLMEFVPETEGITREDWEKAARFKCVRPKDMLFENWHPEKTEWGLGEGGIVEEREGKIYRTGWFREILKVLDNPNRSNNLVTENSQPYKDQSFVSLSPALETELKALSPEQWKEVLSLCPPELQKASAIETLTRLPKEETLPILANCASHFDLEFIPLEKIELPTGTSGELVMLDAEIKKFKLAIFNENDKKQLAFVKDEVDKLLAFVMKGYSKREKSYAIEQNKVTPSKILESKHVSPNTYIQQFQVAVEDFKEKTQKILALKQSLEGENKNNNYDSDKYTAALLAQRLAFFVKMQLNYVSKNYNPITSSGFEVNTKERRFSISWRDAITGELEHCGLDDRVSRKQSK